MKRPPFGKILAERLACGDIPQVVHIMAGGGSWDRAQDDSASAGGCSALVLADDWRECEWPVAMCVVRVEIKRAGLSRPDAIEFARHLISEGAAGVFLWWLDRDDGMPVMVDVDGSASEFEVDDLRAIFGEKTT